MRSKSFLAGVAAFLCNHALADSAAECEGWAESGECSLNPK